MIYNTLIISEKSFKTLIFMNTDSIHMSATPVWIISTAVIEIAARPSFTLLLKFNLSFTSKHLCCLHVKQLNVESSWKDSLLRPVVSWVVPEQLLELMTRYIHNLFK